MTITVDAHVDAPWLFQKYGAVDLRRRDLDDRMVDFPSMRAGNLDAAFFALYLSDQVQDALGDYASWLAIKKQESAIEQQTGCRIADNPEAATYDIAKGWVPIFLGLEGGRLIGKYLTRLEWLRNSGVRYLTLTHNRNTSWACSATDTFDKKLALTNFGKQVIEECNRLDILIDVSHASDETAYLAFAASKKPIIASHSGCRKLLDHPRNLPDHLIWHICESGGVVHIPFARRFVGPKAEGIIYHIDHVVQLLGSTKYVGIGSDMDGAAMVDGVKTAADWWRLTGEALSKRGYSDDVIADITGGNTLRVLELT